VYILEKKKFLSALETTKQKVMIEYEEEEGVYSYGYE